MLQPLQDALRREPRDTEIHDFRVAGIFVKRRLACTLPLGAAPEISERIPHKENLAVSLFGRLQIVLAFFLKIWYEAGNRTAISLCHFPLMACTAGSAVSRNFARLSSATRISSVVGLGIAMALGTGAGSADWAAWPNTFIEAMLMTRRFPKVEDRLSQHFSMDLIHLKNERSTASAISLYPASLGCR